MSTRNKVPPDALFVRGLVLSLVTILLLVLCWLGFSTPRPSSRQFHPALVAPVHICCVRRAQPSAFLPRLGAVACEVAALAAVKALQPAALCRRAIARDVALLTAVEARRCALGIGARA